MPLIAIGISEREISSNKFESFVIPDSELALIVKELMSSELIDEAVVLSTCARTEFFAVVPSFHAGIDHISEQFAKSCNTTSAEIADFAHVYYDAGAIRHLFRLTSGIESQIIGESEIIGQVRRAYLLAHDLDCTGPYLEKLFQRSLEVGKRARSETKISQGITSSAYAAVEMLVNVHPGARSALVVGAGEVGSKVISALVDRDLNVHVANRTLIRAQNVANNTGAFAVPFDVALADLRKYDAVIFATASSQYLVTHQMVSTGGDEANPKTSKEIVMVDLGMPRNLDPELGKIADLTLLDLESIYRYLGEQMEMRRGQIDAVEAIIEVAITEFTSRSTSSDTLSPTIASLYQKAEKIKLGELERFRSRLGDLNETEQQAVEALALGIVAKMLHAPVSRLKKTSPERAERLADALNYLFDL